MVTDIKVLLSCGSTAALSIVQYVASGTSQAEQTTSPVSNQMSLLGRVQMVPASSETKVRVTQWVKLDPS